MTVAVDEGEVRTFLTVFSALAQQSLNGHPVPGVLRLSRLHPHDRKLAFSSYRLDAVDDMTSMAIAAAGSGHNAFIEGRLVSFGANGRGKFDDTICVFALAVDSDADKGMAWAPPPGARPTMIVETSPGNYQYWFFFREAISRARARELGKRIRTATRTDACTGNPVQPFRIAGTVNYPDATKIARGRVAVGVGPVSCDPASLWTVEALEALFPPPAPRAGGPQAGAKATSGAIDVDDPSFPADLRDIIVDGVPVGHRSRVFYWMVKGLRYDRHSADEIIERFLAHPDGIAQKYLDPRESGSPQRPRGPGPHDLCKEAAAARSVGWARERDGGDFRHRLLEFRRVSSPSSAPSAPAAATAFGTIVQRLGVPAAAAHRCARNVPEVARLVVRHGFAGRDGERRRRGAPIRQEQVLAHDRRRLRRGEVRHRPVADRRRGDKRRLRHVGRGPARSDERRRGGWPIARGF
jgi:hypothetical protein